MKIAHRGNFAGRNPERENTIPYLTEAIRKGYSVEVDVWMKDGELFLGHDGPKDPLDKINLPFQDSLHRLWWHAKNPEAFMYLSSWKSPYTMRNGPELNVFYHEGKEPAVLTTLGYIWSISPAFQCQSKAVAVLPEVFWKYPIKLPEQYYAVCSDDIGKWE